MVTRRRGVKYRHNKTRTTSKALLRKTRHKNKKNKQNKTKKRYQSGGGPKAPKAAKGRYGVPTEMKFLRLLLKEGKISQETFDKLVEQQKKDHTAEFDIDMEISGLPEHYSVKSANKNENQYSVTIMCGKSNRFITQTGTGSAPYHMIVVLREKHPTKPNKTQYRALEINLRSDNARTLLFGDANDCQIQKIVDDAQRLSDTYCDDDSVENHEQIRRFNQNLKSSFGARIQLAPKKGNPNKNRATRAQASIMGFNPNSPTSRASVIHEDYLSSAPNSGNSQEGTNGGPAGTAPLNLTATSVSRAPGSRNTGSRNTGSRNTSSRNTGSRNTGSRNTGSSRGVNKPPVPQVSYFRSFKPRYRELSTIPELE